MLRINRHFIWSVFLILVVIINLMNVNVVLADDSTPPPPATEEPTQPPVEPTETPVVEETPVSTEEAPVNEEQAPEQTEVLEVLQELPENTDVVVLDENGNVVPLGSQDAVEIILETDPMWCPVVAGVPTPPGGTGCTANFATPQDLINNMDSSNPFTTLAVTQYESNGIVYFTTAPGGSFSLVAGGGNAIETNDYNQLRGYSLILQGGWNGSTGGAATFTGQTNFATNTFITIGTVGNPWVGDITLNDFSFTGVTNTNALTIYTTTGDITLNNVDVANQRNNFNTALLDSTSGDITVQNGSSFDGNTNSGSVNQNQGFSADTTTGTITISDTTFTDASGCLNLGFVCVDALSNYNGATLSAPTVTLTNVSASNNDLSGIQINNANTVTLNNVTATGNGTDILGIGFGSGVDVNGTGSTVVNVTGGTLSNNEAYGLNISNGSLNAATHPTCSGNGYPGPHSSTCYNIMPSDSVPPVLSLPANITIEATGSSGAVVTYSATANDAVSGSVPVTCSPASNSTFGLGTTTVNCSASDASGNIASGSFTVTVQDTTSPTLTLPATMTLEATGVSGATATFAASASDLVDGSVSVICTPPSGSTFGLGTTTVNCNATDSRSNSSSGSFTVTVQDTMPPVISPMANFSVPSSRNAPKLVSYTNPSTNDIVDGPGTATCSPASGSMFPIGDTTVTCTATDNAGNTSTITFTVTVEFTPPANNQQPGSGGIILVTGGELIDLDCFTTANAFGILVTFYNLCDQQAVIDEVNANTLPSALPSGYTLIKGINVSVLGEGQLLDILPNNAGVQMDFTLPGGSDFAVLYWNNGTWVEINQLLNAGDLDNKLSTDTSNELYKLSSSNGALQKVLTTELTGTFVLVQK